MVTDLSRRALPMTGSKDGYTVCHDRDLAVRRQSGDFTRIPRLTAVENNHSRFNSGMRFVGQLQQSRQSHTPVRGAAVLSDEKTSVGLVGKGSVTGEVEEGYVSFTRKQFRHSLMQSARCDGLKRTQQGANLEIRRAITIPINGRRYLSSIINAPVKVIPIRVLVYADNQSFLHMTSPTLE